MQKRTNARSDLLRKSVFFEDLLPKILRGIYRLEPELNVGDLTLAQLRLCILLQSHSKSMSSVSEELGISISAVTQLADRLEHMGMVERTLHTDDRRSKELSLTEHGREIMKERKDLRVRRVYETLRKMPEKDIDTVMQALRILLSACDNIQNDVTVAEFLALT
jgi:DNA-binding MarR family transcriptional regulator